MSRLIPVAQLLLALLVTIGCSGKTETEAKNGTADKNAQADRQPQEEDKNQPVGETQKGAASRSTTETQPTTNPQSTASEETSPAQPIDLAYLPDGYAGAVVLNPGRILEHPAISGEMRGEIAEAMSEVFERRFPMSDMVPEINSLDQAILMVDSQMVAMLLDEISRNAHDDEDVWKKEDDKKYIEGGLEEKSGEKGEFKGETNEFENEKGDFKGEKGELKSEGIESQRSDIRSDDSSRFSVDRIPNTYVAFQEAPEDNGDNDAVQQLVDRALASQQEWARIGQSVENLRNVILGIHNFHDTHGQLPHVHSVDDEGKPLLSWRVHLLPYTDFGNLYDEFRLDEPWDSEHNKTLISRIPEVYISPGSDGASGKTRYLAVRGKNSVLSDSGRRTFAALSDGTSNSVAVVEVAAESAVVWTKPQDYEIEKASFPDDLFGKHDSFLAAFADGHIQSIAAPLDKASFVSLCDGADGVVPDIVSNPIRRSSGPLPGIVLLLRYREPVDAAKEAQRILGEGEIESHEVAGKTYYASSDSVRGCLAIDERTILFTLTTNLPKVLESDPNSDDPLKNELRSISRENDLIAAFVVPDHLREQASALAESLGENLPTEFQDVAKLPAALDVASLQVNLSGDTLAQLRANLNDREVAQGLASAAEKGLGFAKLSLGLLKTRQSRNSNAKAASSTANELLNIASELLNQVRIDQPDARLTVTVATPEKLAERVAVLMHDAKIVADEANKANQLKQIGLGFHNHHDTFNSLPVADVDEWYDKGGNPLLSWRVHILPFAEYSGLYDQFKLDEPWDSEHNIKLLKHMPDIYRTSDDPTKTTLLMVAGKGTASDGKDALRFSKFTDGLSNTIMVVRAGADKAVPWTKPEDLPFNPDDPVATFGKIDGDEFMVLMADGSVHRVSKAAEPETWRALLTRGGGEKVKLPGSSPSGFDVSGKVSFNDGKPLTSGRIWFGHNEGKSGFTHVDSDGTYSLGRLRAGTYTIYFSEPDDKGESGKSLTPIHPKYLSPETSSIQLDLRSDTSFDIVIERP